MKCSAHNALLASKLVSPAIISFCELLATLALECFRTCTRCGMLCSIMNFDQFLAQFAVLWLHARVIVPEEILFWVVFVAAFAPPFSCLVLVAIEPPSRCISMQLPILFFHQRPLISGSVSELRFFLE